MPARCGNTKTTIMDTKLNGLFEQFHSSDNKYQVADEIIRYVRNIPEYSERQKVLYEIKSNRDFINKAEIRGYLDVVNYIFGELLNK